VVEQQTGLVDPALAKALAHPLRAQILAILNKRVASPKEMATTLDERLPNVSYHVRALLEARCIELVRTTPRRGAVEHYYRALVRPFFSDADWGRLPLSARNAISDAALRLISEDVTKAMTAGTFEARPDRHLTRTPLVVDEQGWEELNDRLASMLGESVRIASESADRLARSGTSGIPTKMVLMHFESPSAGELSEPARAARRA